MAHLKDEEARDGHKEGVVNPTPIIRLYLLGVKDFSILRVVVVALEPQRPAVLVAELRNKLRHVAIVPMLNSLTSHVLLELVEQLDQCALHRLLQGVLLLVVGTIVVIGEHLCEAHGGRGSRHVSKAGVGLVGLGLGLGLGLGIGIGLGLGLRLGLDSG